MISHVFLEISGKQEMVSLYVRTYVRFFKIEEMCHLETKMPEQMPFRFLKIYYLVLEI